MKNMTWIGALVGVVVVAIFVAERGFFEVSLSQLNPTDIGTLLATVIFTALVIERAVEVYVKNAYGAAERQRKTDILIAEQELRITQQALSDAAEFQAKPGVAADPQALIDLQTSVAESRDKLREVRIAALPKMTDLRNAKSLRASIIAILFSLAAAIVGVRILGQFLPMDSGAVTGPLADAKSQLFAFRAVDIVLTTFVLAGGADGIHQIINRFTKPDESAQASA